MWDPFCDNWWMVWLCVHIKVGVAWFREGFVCFLLQVKGHIQEVHIYIYIHIYIYNVYNIYLYIYNSYIIHIYSWIKSGRVLNGELLHTKILEVNLFAFAYRLFHEDFSPLDGTLFLFLCLIILIYQGVHCCTKVCNLNNLRAQDVLRPVRVVIQTESSTQDGV